MALHSKYNTGLEKVACGVCIAPIKTTVSGPAPKLIAGDLEDIIDEALKYFRPNLLFKNFSVMGPADVTLIYLTVFITHCLKVVTNENNENDAKKKLLEAAKEAIPLPGTKSFFMGAQIKESKDNGEVDLYASYLKQAKEELINRLLKILFLKGARAPEFKFWVALSKKKFMGLSYN